MGSVLESVVAEEILDEHLFELHDEIFGQTGRTQSDEIVVVLVSPMGREVHRAGPDHQVVDDNKLIVHQAFTAVTQHRYASLDQLLGFSRVEIVTLRDHPNTDTILARSN